MNPLPSRDSLRPRRHRRLPPWLLASGTVLAALLGAAVHPTMAAQATAPSAALPVMQVVAASAQVRTWPRWLQAHGNVAAWQDASVCALVGGLRVVEVRANVGDLVRRGEVLARVDLDALKAERDAAAADLDQTRVQAQRASTERGRADDLHESRAVSDQDWMQVRAQAATTRAQVAAATARLQGKEIALRQAGIVAPDDGVITARLATPGAVEAAGAELFRMQRRARLRWLAELTPEQASAIRVGQPARLTLPDGAAATGSVVRMSPGLSTQARLGIAYADIDAGSGAKAGMYVAGRVELGSAPALVVPARSVLVRDGHSLVARLRGEGQAARVELRRIETGRRLGDDVEVTQGLVQGDRVAAAGTDFIGDGDWVSLAPANPPSKK